MIKLTFLGDIMCDMSVAKNMDKYVNTETGEYDFRDIFLHAKEVIDKSDYVLANLETPISLLDKKLTNKRYEFNSPYQFAQAVRNCGIDFVSTANNHCLDRGLEGLVSTIESLDMIGLDHCGTQVKRGKKYTTVKVGKIKIGIMAYTYGTNAIHNRSYLPSNHLTNVNLLQEQEGRAELAFEHIFREKFKNLYKKIDKILFPDNSNKYWYEKNTYHLYRKLLILWDLFKIKREKVDLLIAYLHIGGQYNIQPSKYTKKVSDWFLKKGCNAVICNHEHVIHGHKIEKGKIATYALGNFCGDAGVTHEPYNRRAEYSIATHVYISETDLSILKITFTVMKTIMTAEGKIETWPAYKLLESELGNKEKECLKKEILCSAKDFSGKEYSVTEQEFELYSIGSKKQYKL